MDPEPGIPSEAPPLRNVSCIHGYQDSEVFHTIRYGVENTDTKAHPKFTDEARLETSKLDPHVDVVTTTANATIMHTAVTQNGRTQPEVWDVIQFLADHGAALDELDGAGRTPIVAADSLPVDQAVDLLTKLITDRGGKPKISSVR